ncbi:hypothetical protein TELCIR_10450, partial [Teladorsagia circumcincta]
MPLTRHYDYDYSTGRSFNTRPSSSPFGGSLAHLETSYHDAYYTYNPSYDLNRSVYTTPSGCSMSYRMNMTIHDPENIGDSSYYDTTMVRKKKKSRVRAALKELLGRSSRRDLFRMDSSGKDVYRSESPRKRREHAANSFPSFATLTPRVSRTPSADAAVLLTTPEPTRDRRRRHHPAAPIKVQSYAIPEPKVVEFARRGRSKRNAFVNSHEWTLSRSVSELRLGIVGTTSSGKTSLVHRYLTGTFTAEESPEGGRFKKEVFIDGLSHLLLIRDEGSASPDVQ